MTYKCPVCVFADDSITLLHVHCINAHPKEFFTCPWCTVPFATLRTLQKHASQCSALDKCEPLEGKINTVLVNGDKCLVCEGRFNSTEAAIKHYKEQHLNFSYICDVCKIYFQHNSSLDIHYAETHPMDNKSTSSSDSIITGTAKQIPSKNAVSTAVDKNHDKATTVPTIKKKKIIANVPLGQKYIIMKWFNLKRCFDCEIVFDSTTEIAAHFRNDHETAVFICDECNNAYLSSNSRSKHQHLKHQAERTGSKRKRNTFNLAENVPNDIDDVAHLPQSPTQIAGQTVIEKKIKSEDESVIDSISSLVPKIVIKTESSFDALFCDASFHDEIVDLTFDDDE